MITPASQKAGPWAGGCQCGAVRYQTVRLGRASICHCRMCQKAMGGFFGPFVTAFALQWTCGAPSYYQSSNRVRRGFCAECGTPLTFEPDTGEVELAIGTLDRADEVPPQIEVNPDSRMPWLDELHKLPQRPKEEQQQIDNFYRTIISNQHPDENMKDRPSEQQ